jgi:hypothetical protein
LGHVPRLELLALSECASTETDDARKARAILQARQGKVVAGLPVLPRADRVRYDEAADLRQHYATTGDRDLVEAETRLKHLNKFFLGRGLAGIGGAEATAYVEHRQGEATANGTVNRELGLLIKMLGHAAENNKLVRIPVIRKLKGGGAARRLFRAGPVRRRPGGWSPRTSRWP